MRSKCKAAIMLVFGVLFLLGTMSVWPEFTVEKYWPLFFILLGIHDLACPCSSMSCGSKGGEKGSEKSCDKESKPASGCCKSGGKGGNC